LGTALAKVTKPSELGIVARKLERPQKFEDLPIFLKMIIFGPTGVGKTLLAASADKVLDLSPCLYYNIEGGETSILMSDKFIPNLWSIPVNDFRVSNMIYAQLCTYIKVRDAMRREPSAEEKSKIMKILAEENVKWGLPFEFLPKSCIFDSITELNKRIMDFIEGTDMTQPLLDFEPDMAQLQDWGKGSSATEKFLRAIRDLTFNIFLLAQDQLFKEETTGSVHIMPEMPGKLPGKIAAYYGTVGYYYMENEDRILLTQPKGRIRAKDQTNAFGKGIKNPDMQKIWDIFIGYKKKLFEATGTIESPKAIKPVDRTAAIAAATDPITPEKIKAPENNSSDANTTSISKAEAAKARIAAAKNKNKLTESVSGAEAQKEPQYL